MAQQNKVDELIDSLPKSVIAAKIPLILNINKGYFKEIESKTVNGKYRDIEVRVFDLGYMPEDYMFICETMYLEKDKLDLMAENGIKGAEAGAKLKNILFEIATKTPYPESDIIDFIALTGIKINEVEIVLKNFSNYGISNLKDVNTLAKLGYLKL